MSSFSLRLILALSVFLKDHKVLTSTRHSVMSERSGGTPPYQSSPRTSMSHSSPRLSLYHSHNPLPREGERLSFTLDDTFRELDEFQEEPPLFLEENSWDGEESELNDPTLTLFNHEHFQVSRVPVYSFSYLSQGQELKPGTTVLQPVIFLSFLVLSKFIKHMYWIEILRLPQQHHKGKEVKNWFRTQSAFG